MNRTFWNEYPLLSWAITLLIGTLLVFEHIYIWAFLWIFYLAYLSFSRALLHTLICIAIAAYTHYSFFPLPSPGPTKAFFSIHSVQRHSSPFQSGWLYRGTLNSSIPCTMTYRGANEQRPRADCDYLLVGELVQRDRFDFAFKARAWERVPHSWSLAEMRYLAKENIHELLKRSIQDPRSCAFLHALFTGDIEHRLLRFEFGRVGLQYLLVISGFHFAILAAFVAYVTRIIVSHRTGTWILIGLLTTYFLFVGNSPPVLRSFLAAAFALIGQLLQRPVRGLNILGACLIAEIIIDPLIVRNVGFQLTFMSCLGIFCLHIPIRNLLRHIFPLRPWKDLTALSPLAQSSYLLSSFFARALTLTIAVNSALFFVILFHFHRFPFLGLLYNLFAPAWTALALSLLLLSFAFYLVFPLLSLPLFALTRLVTQSFLQIVANPPMVLDYGISLISPGWSIGLVVIVIFLVMIYTRSNICGDRSSVG